MGSTSRRFGLLLFFALSSVSGGARAADMKKECVAAYESAQVLRKDRKWKEALEPLEVCSQSKCPGVVRKDCVAWKKEITTNMPTVIFVVRDTSGNVVKDVRVLVDGKVVREELDDAPVTVDPGDHLFRYEQKGAEPIEQSVEIRSGDKDRRLSVTMTALPPPPPPSAPPYRPPVFVYVLGGVGVAGIAAFAALGTLGKSERDDLAATCAPACSDDDVSSVRTKLIAADVSLGVGVAALGVGTYFVLRGVLAKPEAAPPAPEAGALWFDWQPLPGGGMGQVVGRF